MIVYYDFTCRLTDATTEKKVRSAKNDSKTMIKKVCCLVRS